MKKIFFMLFICLIFTGCSFFSNHNVKQPRNIRSLAVEIDKIFSSPKFENAFWGVAIESLDTGKVWYERNPDKVFMPASNQKILTSAAALMELTPDFKYTTTLCRNGEISDGELKGDLMVFGDGDPTMYNRLQKDPRDVFYEWADILAKQGVKKINGNVVGDDNAFDDKATGYNWSLDYLDVWYAAEIGALQLNENIIDLDIIPPEFTTQTVQIIPNLPSKYYTIINQVSVVPEGKSDISFIRPYGTNNIIVKGTIAAKSKPTSETPSITNPTLFYVTVLKEALEEKGIIVSGKAVDCDDIPGWNHKPGDFPIVSAHLSPPLSEITKELMKRSQNLYAETFVKTMGYKRSGIGSFREGRKAVYEQLAKMGISPEDYSYMDSSGLCRYNFVSPHQILKILKFMEKSEYRDVWLDSFPIAGVDGTLAYRMRNSAAKGNVRAKTGTIENVRGLSGYATTADGERVVFSFLVNNHLQETGDTNLVTDNVLKLIAEFNRK